MSGNVFDLGGTMSLGTGYNDPYGGNGVSLAEAGDVRNGSYDYAGTAGGIMYARDNVEAARMEAGYPLNGNTWDFNAATLGISRLLDSGARAYATANGMTPATYAGQNGLTYTNGRTGAQVMLGGGLLPVLLIGGALLLLMK